MDGHEPPHLRGQYQEADLEGPTPHNENFSEHHLTHWIILGKMLPTEVFTDSGANTEFYDHYFALSQGIPIVPS